MSRLLYWRIFGSTSLVGILLLFSPALAETDASNNAIDLICFTDRPAIIEGESTSLHVVVRAQDGNSPAQTVSLQWQVRDGTVQGSGSAVEWNLSKVGIESGQSHRKVTATAKAIIAGRTDSSCLVDVFIGKRQVGDNHPDVRGGLISGRRYLLPSKTEKSGHGLYSYVLLSGKPKNEEETVRYLKTLEACVQAMHKLNNLSRYVRPSHLNATYIPVTALPKGKEDDQDFARQLLSVYDFDRATVLLNYFEKTYDRGPYLISVKAPLSQASEPVQMHILQDFTGVVPELVATTVKDFQYLAAQQRTWTEQSMRVVPSKLRNLIAVAAKEAPGVVVGLKMMVQFIKIGE